MKSPSISDVNSTSNYSESIMIELRDQFALEAMKKILESWQAQSVDIDVVNVADDIARISYEIADAMMEARSYDDI